MLLFRHFNLIEIRQAETTMGQGRKTIADEFEDNKKKDDDDEESDEEEDHSEFIELCVLERGQYFVSGNITIIFCKSSYLTIYQLNDSTMSLGNNVMLRVNFTCLQISQSIHLGQVRYADQSLYKVVR